MRNTLVDSITRTVREAGQSLGLTDETRFSRLFGKNVFDNDSMKEHMSTETFKSIQDAVDHGTPVSKEVAEQVAQAMKNWALDRGATHYTHWFQPLSGTIAEKHDSFLVSGHNTTAIESFSVESLIQQEPDASSFPSGGLRNTFEARGYTAWDPCSPAFLMETAKTRTLCIPSIFISYTGEALDFKTPLLRSLERLDKAATAVCQFFDPNITRVSATLGWEQEYFLIDEQFYNNRPDLLLCGRTLFGLPAARGQQLEDHYFGSIPERVIDFMAEFESECYKLGIPVKTRHNEVAPCQFECAPHFETANVAVDHNQLLMDILDRVARRTGLRALLHEKPFAGVNGSGKHNNWSLSTNTGKNLLSPGKDHQSTLMFIAFFVNVLKAVHQHADLLLASITSAGNEHRLGANEAPPAIISVFTGNEIQQVLDDFVKLGKDADASGTASQEMRLDLPTIPHLSRDNTDRNRTSPFPFTGNKFEFRACGSSANTSEPMTVLNTAVADQLIQFKKDMDARLSMGESKESAMVALLQRYYTEARDIVFNGDNYSEDWVKEAKKRGLVHIANAAEAQDAYLAEKSVELFGRNRVFTKNELNARAEIKLEQYVKKLDIESHLYEEMSQTHVLAAAQAQLNILTQNHSGVRDMGLKDAAADIVAQTKTLTDHMMGLRKAVEKMVNARTAALAKPDTHQQARAFATDVKPLFQTIRAHADALEALVDDDLWRLPKYREMLFIR